MLRGFELVKDDMRKHPNVDIQLPRRGTKGSACYDIRIPIEIIIPPKSHSDLIFTDICAYMDEDEVLMLFVRSSIGCKRGLILSNCTAIIDSDYISSDNGGNIGLKFYNTTDEYVILEQNERVCQAMFTKYFIADNDNCNTIRTGGLGHSGRK